MEILIARITNVRGAYSRFDPAAPHFVADLVRKAVDGNEPFVVRANPKVARNILCADDFGRTAVATGEAADVKIPVFDIGSGEVGPVGTARRRSRAL